MPRILLTTFGSTGDLNPFIALGLGLRERGHEVRWAVEEPFRDNVSEAGFPLIHHLPGSVDAALGPYSRELYEGSSPLASLKVILRRYVLPTLPAKVEELREICTGVDLIVAPSQHFAAAIVSELTGVPWATLVLSPASLPSSFLPAQELPLALPAPLRPAVNRVQWALGLAMLRSVADGPVNAVRAEYGLPPRRNLMNTGNLSPLLAAVPVSPAFVPRQPDWPPQAQVTGFCFWDAPSTWVGPPELAAFLDGTRPVVAVSVGSIAAQAAGSFDRFFQVSIAAIREAGARALVIGAAPGSLPDPLPPDVQALPFVPFSRVYPRCAAVIHHGGIGTTAQALRAGTPMLVVPWGADQFFIGGQVARIGAGLCLSRPSYRLNRVRRAVREFLEPGSSYRGRALSLARTVASEDGVAALCDALQGLLPQPPATTNVIVDTARLSGRT